VAAGGERDSVPPTTAVAVVIQSETDLYKLFRVHKPNDIFQNIQIAHVLAGQLPENDPLAAGNLVNLVVHISVEALDHSLPNYRKEAYLTPSGPHSMKSVILPRVGSTVFKFTGYAVDERGQHEISGQSSDLLITIQREHLVSRR
jgi:hypothetical protein